jgi:hypothetical protein
MPGCISAPTTAGFCSVVRRRRRARPMITLDRQVCQQRRSFLGGLDDGKKAYILKGRVLEN